MSLCLLFLRYFNFCTSYEHVQFYNLKMVPTAQQLKYRKQTDVATQVMFLNLNLKNWSNTKDNITGLILLDINCYVARGSERGGNKSNLRFVLRRYLYNIPQSVNLSSNHKVRISSCKEFHRLLLIL